MPSVVAGILRLTVAALCPFQGILGAMAITAPETSWGLLAVDPVVALCETDLDFVCFDLHNDVAEDGKGEDSL
jgi:hypothetical protein